MRGDVRPRFAPLDPVCPARRADHGLPDSWWRLRGEMSTTTVGLATTAPCPFRRHHNQQHLRLLGYCTERGEEDRVTIDRLRLIRYKGFEEFTVQLRTQSLLVGPNNAGKSTIITALRVL